MPGRHFGEGEEIGILQTRRGDFSPAVGEKSLLGRQESANGFSSLHSIQGVRERQPRLCIVYQYFGHFLSERAEQTKSRTG
jgi:hypothetical protein